MWDKIKTQLEKLNDRERRMVYAAVIALAIFLPYQLIWSPLMNTVAEKRERVAKQQGDLIWMQSKVAEIRNLSRTVSKPQGSEQSVYGIVERTARQQFKGDIRVQQEGKEGIRIQIKNTSFDELMLWLDNLGYQYQVFVKDFKVENEKEAGRVNASILLES
jgi:general secretion pathway protein M